METGKFSDNLRGTENGLVSSVDRAFKSSNSTFQNIGDRLYPLGKKSSETILWEKVDRCTTFLHLDYSGLRRHFAVDAKIFMVN